MCLYPPSMRVIVPGYLHSDNDIGLGGVWGLLIFHGPQKKRKNYFYARLKNFKRFKRRLN